MADQWEADALGALDAVATPEEAETLLARIKVAEQAIRLARLGADREQRWGRVRLLGERRYGELLGPATPGRNPGESDRLSDSGYKQRERAREVAAVPQDIFDGYLGEAEQPTRAGLLRAERDPVAEVLARKKQGDTRHVAVTLWAREAAELPAPHELYVPQGEGHARAMDEALAVLVPWINQWAHEWATRRAG